MRNVVMMYRPGLRLLAAFGMSIAASAVTLPARADALLSRGIGTASCASLVADIKPNEGLNDPVNVMLYSWVQGYISAANVALLEYDKRHVDMNELTETNVLHMIREYCKAHPEKKPANALDAYLKTTKKMRAQWQPGSVEWDE
jgi:hypothetical protein